MLTKSCPLILRATRFTLCRVTNGNISAQHALSEIGQQISHVGAGKRFYSSSQSKIGIVDYTAVKKLPNEPQKLLVDVREPNELKETGQIPSSINIPLGIISQELAVGEQQFKSKYGRSKPQLDTEIIFHCKIGKRSLAAAEAAAALGYKNVKNYEGSWLDWAKREGLPK